MNKRTSALSVVVTGLIGLLLPVAGLADFATPERTDRQTAALTSAYPALPCSTFAPPPGQRQSWNSNGAKGTTLHVTGGELDSAAARDCGPHRPTVGLLHSSKPSQFRIISDRAPPSSTPRVY